MAWTREKLTLLLLVLQVVFLVLFGVLVEYDPSADARKKSGGGENLAGFGNQVDLYYPMFQDVHVMMFIGIGFLLTFLKKYGYGSVGFNFLIGTFVLEWATLMRGFLELAVKGEDKIHVNIKTWVSKLRSRVT
ncbi:ammonium transporter Rh type B-like [Acanthaster planci]|uniref:Ammonium transporter Rh type B-like n=1 Tax=Acanthaster planci TaxID=133434 RepID=A0A8B7ZRB1_ACAPL|nr:ammonium transporter Rh type B-like [Acanthaster planci]